MEIPPFLQGQEISLRVLQKCFYELEAQSCSVIDTPGLGHSFRNLLFSSSEHTNKGCTLLFPTLLLISCVASALQFPCARFPPWKELWLAELPWSTGGARGAPGAQSSLGRSSQPGPLRALPAVPAGLWLLLLPSGGTQAP